MATEMEALAVAITHDLKSPLATVAGCSQLLAHLAPDRRVSREYDDLLVTMSGAIERMRDLIDDLMFYSMASEAPLRTERVELGPLVDEAISTTARVLHLRDAVERANAQRPDIVVDPLPAVTADPPMVRGLVENLLTNAIKYTDPGLPPTVQISAGPAPGQDGYVRVTVDDRGIGIPPGQHEEVFTEFHRAHPDQPYPGTGLGLAICRQIVVRHGGQIGALPREEGGTRLWFTLPHAAP